MGGTVNSIYNNLSFALNLQTDAFFRLQEQAATGSRINRASDDPSAAYRVLGLNSQERALEGYMDTMGQTMSTLEISLTIIEEMVSALADAKVHVSQIASGIHGEGGRETVAEGINNTLEQMVSLANTQHMDEYLFGGGATGSAPYAVERTDGNITSVTYQGSFEDREVEIAAGVQSSAFYVGDEIFRSDSRGEIVFLGDTGAQAGTGTSSVRGDTWLTVTYNDVTSKYELSIDDAADPTVVEGDISNLAVINSSGQVLYVDATDIIATGVDMVRAPGTYDAFETLIYVRDILNNEKGLSDDQLDELRVASMESLEEVRSYLADKSASVGSRIGFLEVLKGSVEDMKFGTQDEGAMLQEADIAQIAIDISRQQILYQMSLSVAGYWLVARGLC